ncbi:MAG: hypothetical protein K9L17_11485 [Clostridiales bacterium]|nr:hypothetical protein [Clostridiales bacterium]MCF8023304.1 hypothetical protein [Clostridiales bacterium]
MYRLVFIVALLFIDQLTRFMNKDSLWYMINTSRASLKEFFIIAAILLVLAIIKLDVVYQKLYGRRPLFDGFYVLLIASTTSTTIDLILFSGGRDFIPVGNYVANLGDFFYLLAMVFLIMELNSNKNGRLSDIIKTLVR